MLKESPLSVAMKIKHIFTTAPKLEFQGWDGFLDSLASVPRPLLNRTISKSLKGLTEVELKNNFNSLSITDFEKMLSVLTLKRKTQNEVIEEYVLKHVDSLSVAEVARLVNQVKDHELAAEIVEAALFRIKNPMTPEERDLLIDAFPKNKVPPIIFENYLDSHPELPIPDAIKFIKRLPDTDSRAHAVELLLRRSGGKLTAFQILHAVEAIRDRDRADDLISEYVTNHFKELGSKNTLQLIEHIYDNDERDEVLDEILDEVRTIDDYYFATQLSELVWDGELKDRFIRRYIESNVDSLSDHQIRILLDKMDDVFAAQDAKDRLKHQR